MIVVLKAPSLAERVARAGGRASDAQERQWTAAAVAAQKQVLATLAQHGIQVRVDQTFSRVINGFSAALDAEAVALLEREPEVAGAYPVRVAYPAAVSSERLAKDELARGAAHRPEISLPGFDGRGVTVALLDTGVDSTQPFLRGRVAEGINVLADNDFTAGAATKPDDATRLERHGTEMAGLLVGDGGPHGLTGVAPGATVLPIRVAGWQNDISGGYAIYARTDQLIAGLERAVDPNQDGDAHDAARVRSVEGRDVEADAHRARYANRRCGRPTFAICSSVARRSSSGSPRASRPSRSSRCCGSSSRRCRSCPRTGPSSKRSAASIRWRARSIRRASPCVRCSTRSCGPMF
jgi:subtilisin family serine protease